ncbi:MULTISPECIES: molybdopterin-dependent oxidoreductase [unclassified Streptomyces]|uniref:molybdopterin-dependent oxidoreductase n=1 Tax=unclassified Streptomyces TaxID=2593676 RepID=UPI00225749D6|nr:MULTISPECIES: molybdopterin-dependent oxidoreductase [unclassified Streptomyces]MCX4403525.1 molybdopterin-dependent oxidoreductase [Streptomyces sp. NBC_01764]MCX5181519.1 molybdopterin-dependent oxidoreductase [Streptomyces sp. NBC_00268]
MYKPELPTSPTFWRSSVRGPWFTSVLGVVLLGGITVLFVTGLVSYAAYNPNLSPVNDMTPDKGLLGFYLFSWPTTPSWLYRLTQGVHVTLGITLIPVLLAKLWSVVPKLFTLPPVRSLAHGLERVSLLLLVGGALFEFTTGVLNVQLDYIFPGSFYPLHFYGAWVFFAAFVAHAVLRVPMALRNLRHLRGEGQRRETEDELVAPDPTPPTVSRRGALGFVGGGSLVLFATTAGHSFDAPLRETAVLAPHGGPEPGSGPGGFQINKTAAVVGIDMRETTGEVWRLVVEGRGRTIRLSRDELLELPLRSAALTIACVEGWSTSDQWWRGVPLRDLARLVGYEEGAAPDVLVESLQRHGAFRHAALRYNQVRDPRSLLALFVNGEDLTPDHGYPARIIVPAAPGVLNTKWVARMTFGDL